MSGTVSERLAAMRAVAEAATPGPWTATDTGQVRGPDGDQIYSGDCCYDGVANDADAEFIATFDPPTVLALLELASIAVAAAEGESRD